MFDGPIEITEALPPTLSEVVGELIKAGATVEPCGSRVTCSPPPANTDADFLVAVPPQNQSAVSNVVGVLSNGRFHWEGSEHYQNAAAFGFMSWRRDDLSFIVSADVDFIRRHRAATALCKRLNLLNKPDRVALFQAVLYGANCETAGT